MKIYAGIGSRETPLHITTAMTNIAMLLEHRGWKLRSGNADGADKAFQLGVSNSHNMEAHLPWPHYNGDNLGTHFVRIDPSPEVLRIAAGFHPAWEKLSQGVKRLMARNVTIIAGQDLNTPADMVICWTKDGKISGGTGHSLRIAQHLNIPIYNVFNQADQDKVLKLID